MKKILVVTLLLISMMLLTIPVSAWNPELNGDANHMGNGHVWMDDVSELSAHWWDGAVSGPEGYCIDQDIYGPNGQPFDGYVNIYESGWINGHWGQIGPIVRNADNLMWRRNYPNSQPANQSWEAHAFPSGNPYDYLMIDAYGGEHYGNYVDENGTMFPAYETGTFHYMQTYGDGVGRSIFQQGEDVDGFNGYHMEPIPVGWPLNKEHSINVTFKTYSIENGDVNLQAVTVWGKFADETWFQIVIIVYQVGTRTLMYPQYPSFAREYKNEGGYQWQQFTTRLGLYVPQNQWTTFTIDMDIIYSLLAYEYLGPTWSGQVTALSVETILINAAADFWLLRLTYDSEWTE